MAYFNDPYDFFIFFHTACRFYFLIDLLSDNFLLHFTYGHMQLSGLNEVGAQNSGGPMAPNFLRMDGMQQNFVIYYLTNSNKMRGL